MLSRILRLLSERRAAKASEIDRDEYAEPFGDIPMTIHHGCKDYLGWAHADPDTSQNGCNHG